MPQSGIFDPFASLTKTSGKPAFLYHYGDIIFKQTLTIKVLYGRINFMNTNIRSETNLKCIRLLYGCSQRACGNVWCQLAVYSDVRATTERY